MRALEAAVALRPAGDQFGGERLAAMGATHGLGVSRLGIGCHPPTVANTVRPCPRCARSGRPQVVRLLASAAGFLAIGLVAVATGTSAPTAAGCPPTLDDGSGPFGRGAPPQRAKIGTGHVLTGVVLSSVDCRPLARARIHLWQANRLGQYVRAGQRDGRRRPCRQVPLRGAASGRVRGSSRAHPPSRRRCQPRAAVHPLRAEPGREARVRAARAPAAACLGRAARRDRAESGVVGELRSERQRAHAGKRMAGDAEVEGGDRESRRALRRGRCGRRRGRAPASSRARARGAPAPPPLRA